MQACVLHAVGDLRCEQLPDPAPRAGEVLVRVAACGVCGSDIPRVFKTGTYRFPLIPGHEFAGEVVAVGEGVDTSLIGTRAAIFPLLPCFRCRPCLIGNYAMCTDYDYLGSRSNGAFAEYVCAPVWNVLPVHGALSLEEAAMTEPAAVALHALRQGKVAESDHVLIFGAGPIGLLVAMWARALHAASVSIVDIDAEKLSFARAQGFEQTFNARDVNVVDRFKSLEDGGASLVIEASGSSVAFEQCMHTAARLGRVVLLGNPEGGMQLTKEGYWAILRKQLTITGSWNSSYNPSGRDDWRMCLDYMANGRLNVKPLITHRVDLPGLLDAMTMIRERKSFSNKVLFVNE
ncbi:MAG TPA: galactitol-1-phosphate 5-dehydrogenase [Candidatus Hydrogenedentes bacterium]|nr:galactitol-1-phosphate 5-dehydrogenase [Candidatus Hydrogenedentota bacterium]